jgi:hypothetical protein
MVGVSFHVDTHGRNRTVGWVGTAVGLDLWRRDEHEYRDRVSVRRCSAYPMCKIGSFFKVCVSLAVGVVVQDCSSLA